MGSLQGYVTASAIADHCPRPNSTANQKALLQLHHIDTHHVDERCNKTHEAQVIEMLKRRPIRKRLDWVATWVFSLMVQHAVSMTTAWVVPPISAEILKPPEMATLEDAKQGWFVV